MGSKLLEDRRIRPPLAWYGVSWAYSDPDPEPEPPPASPGEGRADLRPGFDREAFGAERRPGRGQGVIFGRFLPPHRGHQYLVDFARGFTPDLSLFLRVSEADPISGEVRQGWLRELFPGVAVVPVPDEDPSADGPREDWAALVRQRVGRPDYLFASEAYGPDLAERLGAAYIPVDPERRVVPVSGAQVRADPWSHWDDLPPCVRPHYLRRVSLIGPESTGKSTLARQLAEHYGTVAAEEYARVFSGAWGSDWVPEDTQAIALGQLAAEDALARRANRLLFCDTDLLQVRLWSERLFGMSPDWIREEAARRSPDLTLVMEPDVPFVGPPGRDRPEERRAFLDRCLSELASLGRPFVRITGAWPERLARALAAVDGLRPGTA
jgi:HTH-type transcriptional regulator, transcriptional repressor of NAD biosynthesis genes